jgi:hypothetical protein
MNVSRRIQLLITRQARAEARQKANFVESMRRSALAERQMIRLEREMSRTDRIVTRLVHGGTSPSEEREMDKTLVRVSENIGGIERNLARLAKRPSTVNRRRVPRRNRRQVERTL